MRGVFRGIFKFSRIVHKYIGLVVLVYFFWMGLSGVLLNHSGLISGFSVPASLVPDSHVYKNWNRASVREMVVSRKDPMLIYLAGKLGVWRIQDGGTSFEKIDTGFPESAYYQDTRCLLLDESDANVTLYAGTRAGLYSCDPVIGIWQPVAMDTIGRQPVVDIVNTDDRLLAVAHHQVFGSVGQGGQISFEPLRYRFNREAKPSEVPLFRFLLKLHDGSLLGIGGKLFVDVVGMVMVFLSVSGIYIWYIPWRKKKSGTRRSKATHYKFFFDYHLKLGIYTSLFIALIALSGVLIRPPFLVAIMGCHIPQWAYPPDRAAEEWCPKIGKAAYLPNTRQVLLATRSGFFTGPVDGSRDFNSVAAKVQVSGMGATALSVLPDDRIAVGSFSGLHVWDLKTGETLASIGVAGQSPEGRRKPPGKVTGALFERGQPLYAVDYSTGITAFDSASILSMPEKITTESSMSLWHFLFELHNGRIFRQWLGSFTWLMVPVGGFLLLMIAITGTYDWVWRKTGLLKGKTKSSIKPEVHF